MNPRFLQQWRCRLPVLTLALSLLASCASSGSKPDPTRNPPDLSTLNLMPGMEHPLPCRIVLPDDFVAAPYGRNARMDTGMLWGKPETLNAIRHDSENGTKITSFKNIQSCVFVANLSEDVAQVSQTQFNLEPFLVEWLKKDGLTNVKTEKYAWGRFPVLACECKRPDGVTEFAALIGLNVAHAGWTVIVEFRCPPSAGHPTAEERTIWRNFLEQSYQLPEPFYSEAMGYVHVDGQTTVKSEGVEFDVVAESGANSERAILIDSHRRGATYEVAFAEDRRDWQDKPGLLLVFKITDRVNDHSSNVFYQGVFVTFKPVGELTLIGRTLRKLYDQHEGNVTIYARESAAH